MEGTTGWSVTGFEHLGVPRKHSGSTPLPSSKWQTNLKIYLLNFTHVEIATLFGLYKRRLICLMQSGSFGFVINAAQNNTSDLVIAHQETLIML